MKKFLIILSLGLLGWALCGAIMGIGMSTISIQTTLIIHLIGAPVIFGLISYWYFEKFHYTNPLQTAIIFLTIVIVMDAGLVAPVFVGSYEMFESPMGTWIPFLLIFLSTYTVGRILEARNQSIGEP